MDIPMHIIAHIETAFSSKFGIPRQSGLVPALRGTIVFTPEYRNPDAVRGLEGYSHLWLIWQFSQNFKTAPRAAAGHRPFVHPDSEATNASVFLLRVLPTDRMRSDSPPWKSSRSNTALTAVP